MTDGLECFDEDSTVEENNRNNASNFFGCYLLVSQNVKYRGKTYIGFTVDPNRRIRQHNGGRIKGGAKYTSGRGPWDMVLIVHGFPNDISALRFEWAWQNPNLSRRLSEKTACRQPRETPFDYRFRVLSQMLRIGPWNRLGLVVRWINQNYVRQFHPDLTPPLHIPVAFGPVQMEHRDTKSLAPLSFTRCGLCSKEIAPTGHVFDDVPLTCPASCPSGRWHLTCLARHMLAESRSNPVDSKRHLLPLTGTCPGCLAENLFWPQLIDRWKRSGGAGVASLAGTCLLDE